MDEDRANQRAQRDGELLRLLAENVKDYAIFVVDDQRRVQTWTKSAELLLGYSEDEILDRSADILFTPEDNRNSVPAKEIEAAVTTGRGEDDRWHVRKDGTRIWVTGVMTPLWEEPGILRGFAKIMRDRTDWKLAEEAELAMQDQEARLGLALDAGRMGTWQWDIRTNQILWSPQLEAIHGLAPGTFAGTFEAYQQDMHPEDREFVLRSISEAVATGNPYHIEYRLVWPDGTVHWIESRGRLFRDEAGQPARMIGVCMEITPRKTTEHDLRFLAEASRSLASLVDYESTLQKVAGLAVPHFADWCAVYLPEKDNRLRQLAVAHTDPSKVELAKDFAARWPSDPNTPGGIYDVFRNGRAVLVEEVTSEMLGAAAQDDEHFAALRELGLKSYMSVPLVIREGPIGVITFIAAESGRRYTAADLAMAEDLARRAAIATENARLYAKLRAEGRRKDEFLAMLAHELRNPLASVRSGTDLLSMLGTDQEVVTIMQQQVEHLTRLVDDLMDVSRVMRGRVELRKERVELSGVVSRAVDTMRPMLDAHRQQLDVSLHADPIWVSGDAVRLTQVVTNLLNNASKYSEPEARIWLSTELRNGGASIRIRDEGIGIEQETLQQVFDLFTQADRSLDRSQGGLGIGLTVVRSLVEGHGGSVSVHSEGANRGSEFTVWLPTAPAPQKLAAAEADAGRPPIAQKILVVDDNVPAVKLLSLLLKKLGDHEIFTAHDGEAALREAREHHPELILLDIGLPLLDGFEVVRQLRRWPEFQSTQIVALTGYGSPEDRRQSMAAGFDEHLIKPPGAEDLRRLLRRARAE